MRVREFDAFMTSLETKVGGIRPMMLGDRVKNF